LSGWVTHIHLLSLPPGQTQQIARLPDGTTSILFRSLWNDAGRISVIGPSRRARYKAVEDTRHSACLVLRPGVGPTLLGVPAADLLDRVVALEELWGEDGRRLQDGLADAGAEEAAASIGAALLQRAARRPSPAHAAALLGRALGALREAATPVRDLARRLDLSERQLRRLFHDGLGLSPKYFARLARMRRAIARVPSLPPGGWAELASATGFYDQAHLVSEFRDLLSTTPERFRRGEAPQLRSCVAA
jgi:AraC-like DNA-binding protein